MTLLFLIGVAFADLCAGVVDAPFWVTETHATRIAPFGHDFKPTDLQNGWWRVGADGFFLRLSDLTLHTLPLDGATYTFQGRTFHTLARSRKNSFAILRSSPLAPLLLTRPALLQFGIAHPLASADLVPRTRDFAFSPDERRLAIAEKTEIDYVRSRDGYDERSFTTEPRHPLDSRWVSNRRQIIVAFGVSASAFLFDVPTGQSETLFRLPRSGRQETDPIAYSTRTHRLAIADNRADGSTLRLLNQRAEGVTAEFPEPIAEILVAPNGRTLVAYGEKHIRVYDAYNLGGGAIIRTGGRSLKLVQYAPDGGIVHVDVEGHVHRHQISE